MISDAPPRRALAGAVPWDVLPIHPDLLYRLGVRDVSMVPRPTSDPLTYLLSITHLEGTSFSAPSGAGRMLMSTDRTMFLAVPG